MRTIKLDTCRVLPAIAADDVAIVQLGRYGDLLNVLPIAHHIHNSYKTPWIVVSRDFADLLDGVSYVKKFVVDLPYGALGEALKIAKTYFPFYFHTQPFAEDQKLQLVTDSFLKEIWRLAGMLPRFYDTRYLPKIDRRDKKRELAQFNQHRKTTKPLMLTNLTYSYSSPFVHGKKLLKQLEESWPNYEILEVGSLKLHRIYDILGFIERAALVISIDTALLHFACTCKTPIIGLVNNFTWSNTIPRIPIKTIKYNDATIDSVNAAIKSVKHIRIPPQVPLRRPPNRKIFHATTFYKNPNARQQFARASWKALKDVIPCYLKKCTRYMQHNGSENKIAFFKDVIAEALRKAKDSDIILFTNDDIICHPDLSRQLRYYCSIWGCTAIRRCELNEKAILGNSPGEWAELARTSGIPHYGRDSFAFTKTWWKEHGKDFPDFAIGGAEWDTCLAVLMRKSVGYTSIVSSLQSLYWPAEMPLGWTAHYAHKSMWFAFGNFWHSPVNIHNRHIFRKWSEKHQPTLTFDKDDILRA